MTAAATNLLCSEWGVPVKVVLIVIISIVLLEVAALLVWELFCAHGRSTRRPVQADAPIQEAAAVVDEEPPEEEEPAGEHAFEPDEAATCEDDDEADSGTMIVGDTRVKVRYDRSFTATLIQAEDLLKGFYSELRNELLCYKFKQRMSWSNESWYIGRKTYAKFAIRGKTLSLYLALDPKAFEGTKYNYRNASGTAKYRDVPMCLKIRSDRGVRWAKELIMAVAAKGDLKRENLPKENFRPDYRDTKSLVQEKLIKLHYIASPDKSQQDLERAAAASLKVQDQTPRDFITRLMRADSETKARYSAIKNELLRYGMKPRMSQGNESWYIGRTTYAKFAIRGKTLSLYMALDPKEFEGTKYNFRNAADVGKYETVPMRVNLKSERAVKWVKELLAHLAEKKGWERIERVEEDFRYVEKKAKPAEPEKRATKSTKPRAKSASSTRKPKTVKADTAVKEKAAQDGAKDGAQGEEKDSEKGDENENK